MQDGMKSIWNSGNKEERMESEKPNELW